MGEGKNWPPIYHSLGQFSYWHLIPGAPQKGTIKQRAAWLLGLYERHAGQPEAKWPISTAQRRGLVIELVMACRVRKRAVPEELVHLIALALEMPAFLCDPVSVYEGTETRGRPGQHDHMRSAAMWLDRRNILTTGKPMTPGAINRRLGVPTRTLTSWRKQRDYAEFLAEAALMARTDSAK